MTTIKHVSFEKLRVSKSLHGNLRLFCTIQIQLENYPVNPVILSSFYVLKQEKPVTKSTIPRLVEMLMVKNPSTIYIFFVIEM